MEFTTVTALTSFAHGAYAMDKDAKGEMLVAHAKELSDKGFVEMNKKSISLPGPAELQDEATAQAEAAKRAEVLRVDAFKASQAQSANKALGDSGQAVKKK